jgi:hypothetical protein
VKIWFCHFLAEVCFHDLMCSTEIRVVTTSKGSNEIIFAKSLPQKKFDKCYLIIIITIWRYSVWTQDLALVGRHSNTWITPSTLFALVIFQIGSSFFAQEPTSGGNPPTSALYIAGTIDVHYHLWLICWKGISLSFCPGWPQTIVLHSSPPDNSYFFDTMSH